MKFENILKTIGSTPHVRINKLFPESYEVWMKLERANPGGSIKDRIALSMVEDAEERGILKPGSIIGHGSCSQSLQDNPGNAGIHVG